MDDARFDALTKALSTTYSRRGAARLLGGISLGGLLAALDHDGAATALRNGGYTCNQGQAMQDGQLPAKRRLQLLQDVPVMQATG